MDQFTQEFVNKRNKRMEQERKEKNVSYQKTLQNSFYQGLDTAFTGMNDNLAKRQQENEEKSLLNTDEFINAFNQVVKEKTNNDY